MSSFKFYYLEACETLRIKHNGKLLENLKENTSSTNLDLSTIELTNDICKALGLALSKDVSLQELNLSNCLLNDEGLSSILIGLEANKFLITLNLKGNNIRRSGTAAIGKFLRHNNHLLNLSLEWNGTGIFPEKFAYLCEGLSFNNTLKSLDLRNNQLNHVCAQSIADVLSRNSSLQSLDLRWNAIGLIGGRAILKSLTKNKNILKLQITGNEVPLEIQNSIELVTSLTAERYLKNNENIQNTKIFASKLQEIEMDQKRQLSLLMQQLEKKERDMVQKERWYSSKLGEMKDAVSDKNYEIEDLIKKIQDLQKSSSLEAEKKNNLALALNEMETKYKESYDEFHQLLERERKDKESIKRKFLEETGSIKEENLFLKQQIQNLKMAKENSEDQIMKLKKNISKMENMAEVAENSFKDQLSTLKKEYEQKLKEIDLVHKNELEKMKEESLNTERKLRQQVSFLEKEKQHLEEQIMVKETESRNIEVSSEERLEELRKKMETDEEKLKKKMEGRIELLESANKKQEQILREQLQAMHEIKLKASENDLLLAEEARNVQQLQLSLESKDAEMEAAVAKVKLEVKEQLEELNRVKLSLENSLTQNASLEHKIEELKGHYEKEIKIKNEEIQNLKREIENQKCKMRNILQNETERMNELQNSFNSYMKFLKLTKSDLEDKSPNEIGT